MIDEESVQRALVAEAKAKGIPDSYITAFLADDANANDYHRLISSYSNITEGNPHDSQTTNPAEQAANRAAEAARVAAGEARPTTSLIVGNLPSGTSTAERYRAQPVASMVTTMGASAGAAMTPTVGPVGLAYPDDPVNYATMQQGGQYGYSQDALYSGNYAAGAGAVSAPATTGALPGAGSSNMMVYVLLAGAAVAAYYFLRK